MKRKIIALSLALTAIIVGVGIYVWWSINSALAMADALPLP